MQITGIYDSFTDLVEPYSINEQFLDVSGVMYRYESPKGISNHHPPRVLVQTGNYTRVGISANKILAKTECDNFSKKI